MTLRELAGAHQMIFTLLVPPLQVMYPNPVEQGVCHNVALAIHI